MTGKFHTLLFCLAALLVGAGASRAASGTAPAARGAASYTLQDVMNAPDAFAGSDVYFYCRFAGISKLFKPAQTRLSPTEFVNFAAWPFRAELWTADGRKNNLPTLYLAKKDHAQLDVMRSLKKYDLVAVSGRVVSAYSGVPWIEVRRIEPVGQAGAVLTDLVVREMRTGHDALLVEDAAAASACFERILALELPADVFAAACEYSARASIMLGNTAMARDRLVMAVKAGRDEPDVRLAIADLSLKLGDPERALAESRHAVAVPALRIAALGVAAEANAQQGRHAEALAALAAAGDSSRLSPRDEATLDLYRARIHTMSGRTGEAEQLYSAQTLPDAPAVVEPAVRPVVAAEFAVPPTPPVAPPAAPPAASPVAVSGSGYRVHTSLARSMPDCEADLVAVASPVAATPVTIGENGGVTPTSAMPALAAMPQFTQAVYEVPQVKPIAEQTVPSRESATLPLMITSEAVPGTGPVYAEVSGALVARSTAIVDTGETRSGEASSTTVQYLEPAPLLVEWDGRDSNGLVAFAAFTPRTPLPEAGMTAPTSAPAVFSFEPDRSPTIIAGYGSDAEARESLPARNPNLYRKHRDNGRKPAEVIDGSLPPAADLYTMGAANGRVHRTQVLLPSVPPGIGMDYSPVPLR